MTRASSTSARSRASPVASARRCGRSTRSGARRSSSSGPRARTSSTPKATATSTSCSRGVRRSSVTPIPAIVEAVQRAAAAGTSYGAPTAREVELAEADRSRVPSVDKVRLVSSGTEATMTAVRLARGFTGRAKVLKFAGCYHGHLDALLVAAGSGVATLGLPGSAGVTPGAVADTVVVPFNDIDALDAGVRRQRRRARGRAGGAGRRQHGSGPARPRLPRAPGPALHRARRALRVRRGDHRVPARSRPGRRVASASPPTSRSSAR